MKPTLYLRSGSVVAPRDLVRPRRGSRSRPVTPLEAPLLPPAVEALPDLDRLWFPTLPRSAA